MILECYLSCFKVIGEKRRNILEEEEYISKKLCTFANDKR